MLETERRNPKTTHIDQASTDEIVTLINEANYESIRAVENASAEIARAIDAVTAALERGGRLVYMGAGTSGRLATADAADAPAPLVWVCRMRRLKITIGILLKIWRIKGKQP